MVRPHPCVCRLFASLCRGGWPPQAQGWQPPLPAQGQATPFERGHGRRGGRWGRCLARNAQGSGEARVELGGELIEPTERSNSPLLRPTGVVAVGLYELDVAAGAGVGELDEQATTLNPIAYKENKVQTLTHVPLPEIG